MPPLSATRLLTEWTWSTGGVLLAVALTAGYLALVVRARRRGVHWPWTRVALFLVLGIGVLIYATCGPVGAYRTTFMFMFAVQVVLVGTIVPVGVALGDPMRLFTAAAGHDHTWLHRGLRSRVAKIVLHPAVSAVLDISGIMLVFFTGYGVAATRSGIVEGLLLVHLVTIGVAFGVPLLVEELLPRWATPPVRIMLAFFDGLIDAVPGIVVFTRSYLLMPTFPGFGPAAAAARDGLSPMQDQRFAGGALLLATELIGVPVLGAVFMEWLRSDAVETREVDARLDEQEAARRAVGASQVGESGEPDDEPWWVSDPRLSDRFRR
ncbi:cytochrome c oxidase assembly protein [Flexivirga sp. ID2601S]|uniref:Cytochrome c oxidase assembly protein n=1 Tax=Flexivirga aerilata TaxID=1656889 RepID=A0A849AJZ1_9MICO|nr:cytochrome c oxidase assembly protein [Flexivirga aerilata]